MAHPLERAAGSGRVIPKRLAVRVASGEQRRIGEEPALERGREDREVLAKERARPRLERDERPLGVAPGPHRQSAHRPADRGAQPRGHETAVGARGPLVPGGHAVPVVAEEQLIRPLPGQHDLDVLAREPRDEVERHARRERDRLVLVPDEAWQRAEELGRGDDHLAVHGAHRARHEPRVRELVRVGVGNPHREGADRLLDHTRHQRSQPARVEPAREKEPEWHVAHEVAPDGGLEPRPRFSRLIGEGRVGAVRVCRQSPVAALLKSAAR